MKEVEIILEERKAKEREVIAKIVKRQFHLSASSLKAFKQSPKAFIDYKLKEWKQTDAMLSGSMVHCLILEPEEFEKRYITLDCQSPSNAQQKSVIDLLISDKNLEEAYSLNYSKYDEKKAVELKDKYSEFIEFSKKNIKEKKQVVSKDLMIDAHLKSEAIKRNSGAKKVLEMIGQTEVELNWYSQGIKMKGFVDGLGDCILDLKGCPDVSKRKFTYKMVDEYIPMQFAIYADGLQKKHQTENLPCYVICFDNNFEVGTYLINSDFIWAGRMQYMKALKDFKRCIMLDEWHRSVDFYGDENGLGYISKPSFVEL